MKEYIIEKVEDLSFDAREYPLSAEIKTILIQYLSDNPILDNGQMVLLNSPDKVKDKMFDYCQKILIEFIESEKNLKKCYEIKNRYISNIDNVNNTNLYVKTTSDIIISMDKANKYIWNIAKLHIDNIENYNKEYEAWQERTTRIKKDVRDNWNLIYKIRCEFEHPNDLNTTSFSRKELGAVIPQIIHKGKNYDLLQLAEDSLLCINTFLKAVLGASLLYSKYLVLFTDESRKNLNTL